jgi:citrate synthase
MCDEPTTIGESDSNWDYTESTDYVDNLTKEDFEQVIMHIHRAIYRKSDPLSRLKVIDSLVKEYMREHGLDQ